MTADTTATAPLFRAGDMLVGRYRLVRQLGEGGMGLVWEGRQVTTDKPVAIKALKAETDTDVARLVREARLSASLSHRNIVQVFDFWEPEGDGPVFMVMELLKGETLGSYLERAKRLTASEARTVGLGVAAAIRYAHAQNIVHRDLKPDNVFLVRAEADGPPEIKVLDFGIARPTVSDTQVTSVTRTGSVIGTPHYMPPEQIYAEKDIDGRADVWALGVILYECLAGVKPFDGESFGHVFRKVTKGELRPLSEAAPDVPPAMASLVMAMLSIERQHRPTSAQVHASLDDLATNRPSLHQQTQWLPPPARPAGPYPYTTPSSAPPPYHPSSGHGFTPPALAAAPSLAVPTTTRPPAPRAIPIAALAVGAAVVIGAVVGIGLTVGSRASTAAKPATVELPPVEKQPAALAPVATAVARPAPPTTPSAAPAATSGAAAPAAMTAAAPARAAATSSTAAKAPAAEPRPKASARPSTPSPASTDFLGQGRF